MPSMLMQMIPALLGGVLGGGDPTKTTTNQEMIKQLTESSQQSSGTKQFDTFNEAIEDPRFSAFRQGLLPQFNQELNRVQRPIFGDAEKAGALQDINAQFAGIGDRINQQGAARGQLGSGLMPQLDLQAQLAGAGSRASFLGSLPMLEEQNRRQATAGLLGQGMQFAGRAPISQRSRGIESFESFTDAQERMERETQGTQVQQTAQPSMGQRALGAGLGIIGKPQGQQFGTQVIGNTFFNPNNNLSGLPLGNTANPTNFSMITPDINFNPSPFQGEFNLGG